MGDTPTRCIECGGLTNALNEDEEGVPCPACADRLLETLPGVFHSPWAEPVGEATATEREPEFAERERDEPRSEGGGDSVA